MSQVIEKQLILKFLTRNYPVHRIKSNMRFKRTIVIETGETYVLNDKNAIKELYGKLLNVIKIVFSSNDDISKSALKDFLNLK
jgi:hypothetical protein